MKKIKKLTSFVLALMLCHSVCGQAVALEIDQREKNISDVIVSSERQRIYEQLEKQNATGMAYAHEYVYATTNAANVTRGSDDDFSPVNAQYGGTLGYKTSVAGIATDVVITYLDRENSYYYLLNDMGEVDVYDVIFGILGYIPYVGAIASTIANAKTVVTSAACTSIREAGGYAQITVIDDNELTGTTLAGWTTYPKICLTDPLATNIVVTLFPETHPFDEAQ